MEQNVKGKLKVAFLGKHLPKFTKSLLRDGQGYYLYVINFPVPHCKIFLRLFVQRASNIAHVIFIWQCFSSTPFVNPCSIAIPAVVMITTMSAHVYRNIRLGFYRDFTNSSPILYQTNRQDESNISPHRSQGLPLAFCRNSDTTSGLSSSDSGSEQGHQEKHVDVVIDIYPGHLDSVEVEKQTEVEIVEKAGSQ
jgi:hypothetical protein